MHITYSWSIGTMIRLTIEEFKLMLMKRSNAVLGIMGVSGGISDTVTYVRILLQAAINASGIRISHNHPSGNLNPRESDTKEAGNLMDIQLLDHLILSKDDNSYSFEDNGL